MNVRIGSASLLLLFAAVSSFESRAAAQEATRDRSAIAPINGGQSGGKGTAKGAETAGKTAAKGATTAAGVTTQGVGTSGKKAEEAGKEGGSETAEPVRSVSALAMPRVITLCGKFCLDFNWENGHFANYTNLPYQQNEVRILEVRSFTPDSIEFYEYDRGSYPLTAILSGRMSSGGTQVADVTMHITSWAGHPVANPKPASLTLTWGGSLETVPGETQGATAAGKPTTHGVETADEKTEKVTAEVGSGGVPGAKNVGKPPAKGAATEKASKEAGSGTAKGVKSVGKGISGAGKTVEKTATSQKD
jgi:hypothetical protein